MGSCHRRCFGITLSNPSHEFLESTDYTFEPDPSEDARRHYRFRTLLALRLAKLYGKLPNEIWLMVSKHLIYECAASVGQALWRTRDALKSYDRMIDVSLDVWARYICIDGVRYVAALSNEDDGRGDMSIISTGGIADDKLPRINTIYVLENHMGLRQVIFATSKELSKLPTLEDAQPGFWWRTISMESRKLQVKSDVSRRTNTRTRTPTVTLSTFANDWSSTGYKAPHNCYQVTIRLFRDCKVACSYIAISDAFHSLCQLPTQDSIHFGIAKYPNGVHYLQQARYHRVLCLLAEPSFNPSRPL